ncbi:MAG: polyhydroxyalkanoate synthesis repressor PhaR [Methyloligella sp.]|nr:MAG: polyhydroxyalkanoate synthesis repressor PhaR [Methyloligella sp.]
MTTENETILIKRYASRRLYNTMISDYVTLDEIAQYIRDGKDVKIVDRKSGDDLTRQYLMQIITDYESRGENVLPINVLTDIVRSYNDQAQNFIPDFLSKSYEMLKQQQQEVLSNFSQNIPDSLNPLNNLPKMEGLDQWQKMQANFLNQMMGPIATSMGTSMGNNRSAEKSESEVEDEQENSSDKAPKTKATKKASTEKDQDIEAMKKQLADLQSKLQDM